MQDPQALTAWLYQTSTRLVIDRARQRTLGEDSLLHLRSMLQPSQASSEGRVASRQQLHSLVNEVPPPELEAAILSRFDQLTHPEIAEVMGVAERTVRRLLERFDGRSRQLVETRR